MQSWNTLFDTFSELKFYLFWFCCYLLFTEIKFLSEFFAKSAQQHPKYKSGEWSTLEDVYAHFINTFDDKSNPNGQV